MINFLIALKVFAMPCCILSDSCRAMDPTYPLVPFASFLTAFLLIITLFVTLTHKLVYRGVCMLMCWTIVMLFINGVHTIVWAHSVIDVAPIFCDICGSCSHFVLSRCSDLYWNDVQRRIWKWARLWPSLLAPSLSLVICPI
jgi:hypothetical protein